MPQVGYSHESLEGVTMHSGLRIPRCVSNVDDSDGDNDGNQDLVLN